MITFHPIITIFEYDLHNLNSLSAALTYIFIDDQKKDSHRGNKYFT